MPSLLLIDYLERSRAFYRLVPHPVAYTAEETVRETRIPASHFAKVVMVRIDGELAMMVIPPHYRVALERLRQALAANRVELAEERHFQRRFPRCELGAMPPFGHLFGLRAFMVPVFDETAEIHFKAGTHTELMRMPFSEFKRLAHIEPVAQGAVPRIRKPRPQQLQRLFDLAHTPPRKEASPRRLASMFPS